MVLVALTPGSALADDEFFWNQFRPILVERCQSLHGEQKPKGGLLTHLTRDMLLRGGDSGSGGMSARQAGRSLLI